MPTSTLVPARSDPLRTFKFQVQIMHPTIPGLATLGFMAVSGLQVSTEQISYREGGFNTFTRKMPGQSDFPPVVMSRGQFQGTPWQWNWFKQIFQVGTGKGSNSSVRNEFRATVLIRVLPHPTANSTINYAQGGGNIPVKQNVNQGIACYKLYNAWPLSMTFSDLDAGSSGGVAMEQLTLAHEGLRYAISNYGAFVNESAIDAS